jgi:hypothetical protein
VGESVRDRTSLHVYITPGLFHGAGVDPVQCKATSAPTLMYQPRAGSRPCKSVKGASRAPLRLRVPEFIHARFHRSTDALKKAPNGLLWLPGDFNTRSVTASASPLERMLRLVQSFRLLSLRDKHEGVM